MPNAHDQAAHRLRRMADQLAHDARILAVAIAPADVAGGPVRWALERALDDVGAAVHRAVADLDRLAAICDQRTRAHDRAVLGDVVDLLRERGTAVGTTRTRTARP